MKIIGLIPARYDSNRFPGKVLAEFEGKTILQHVYEKAKRSSLLEELVVATDDKRVYDAAVGFGAPVVITPKKYSSGTDRIADALSGLDCEIAVNIQGDQPCLVPEIIDETITRLMSQPDLSVATPICTLTDVKDVFNPNIVKVVIDQKGYALYFSRSPIPYINTNVKNIEEGMVFYKHIGIYAFRKKFLDMYSKLNKSSLEVTEKLEQLRIIENGYKIMTVKTVYDSPSVDIKEDIENISSTCKQ